MPDKSLKGGTRTTDSNWGAEHCARGMLRQTDQKFGMKQTENSIASVEGWATLLWDCGKSQHFLGLTGCL